MVFGYVAHISHTASSATWSPLFAQVAIEIPFKWGECPEELQDSWVFARANAYSSKACLPSSYQVLHIGAILRGMVEKCHAGDSNDTAQLTCLVLPPL